MSLHRFTFAALFLLLSASFASAFDSKRDALWAAVRATTSKQPRKPWRKARMLPPATSMA